jgi:FMN phosphatase YigB (HAD superfamily)
VAARAVAFDIGGVLEITPETGWAANWEKRLGLAPGGLNQRLGSMWRAGALGTISERQVYRSIREILGLSPSQADALMADMWTEYLGELNTELADYARRLRARCRTGIISNSFAGARWRERERYHFEHLADVIVYSHLTRDRRGQAGPAHLPPGVRGAGRGTGRACLFR